MSIPLRNITEVLGIVLTESLKYHPNHIILLKLKGDLQYGNFNIIFYILLYINFGKFFLNLHLKQSIFFFFHYEIMK